MNEKNIGNIISKLREEKGLTQKELADKLNVSDKTISKWETGANLPNIDMIYRISRLFKVSFQNLLKARLEEENIDEKLIKDIMNEFTETNKRKNKIIKIGFIIALIISLILVITIIFTSTFNRFKVYNVGVDKNNSLIVNGIYVETRIKDNLVINNLQIKDREVKDTDTISIDIYFMENDKKVIIYTASNLTDISFSNYQTFIEIKDLTKYIDNLYVKVTIIDNKNNIFEYEDKLKFKINFSNNKIYNNELIKNYDIKSLDKNFIKEKLLEKGFKENVGNILNKNTKNSNIIYYYDVNKLLYVYDENKFSYQYTYYFDLMILEVTICDKNNIEIDNYKYDVYNDKVITCKTGSCSNYDVAMQVLNENILNYLYNG